MIRFLLRSTESSAAGEEEDVPLSRCFSRTNFSSELSGEKGRALLRSGALRKSWQVKEKEEVSIGDMLVVGSRGRRERDGVVRERSFHTSSIERERKRGD
jgi:hypothetical protein